MTSRRSRLRGYLAVLGAATLWGVAGVVAKALFNRRIEPQTLLEIRLTGAFLVLLFILIVRHHPIRVQRQYLARMGLLGLAMTAAQSTYYLTISLTNVATALFLQYTAPVFVALYGWGFEGERLGGVKVGAIILAVVGSYFLVTGGGGLRVSPLGLTSGILAAVAFGSYAILGRGRVRELGSITSLLYTLGIGALVWSVVVPPWRAYLVGYAPAEWALFAFVIVFGTILPFGLFLYGLRWISSSMASLTATFEPVVGSAAAFLILGELLALPQILGGLAIAGAVAMIQAADIKIPPAPG